MQLVRNERFIMKNLFKNKKNSIFALSLVRVLKDYFIEFIFKFYCLLFNDNILEFIELDVDISELQQEAEIERIIELIDYKPKLREFTNIHGWMPYEDYEKIFIAELNRYEDLKTTNNEFRETTNCSEHEEISFSG